MSSTSSSTTAALLDALADGSVKVVDLTQPLSEDTPVHRPARALRQHAAALAPPPQPLRRRRSRLGVGRAGDRRAHRAPTSTRRSTGSAARTARTSPRSAPSRLVGPAVVIDRSAECAEDPGYLLTVADLEAFEAEHGAIRPAAWVLFRSGWDARAQDAEAFLNAGPEGPVTPGPDVEAARWLGSERGIAGFGVETVGIDAGAAGGFDPVFPVHQYLLGNDRYGLTQLANLGAAAARRARSSSSSPLKLVGGTGSPVRVLALVPSS